MRLTDLDFVNVYAFFEPSIYTIVSTRDALKEATWVPEAESTCRTQWAELLTGFTDLDVVPAHLTLPHLAIFRKRPVLKAVAPLPLHTVMRILVFIPGWSQSRV